jgi:hypothetical protein
MPSKQEELKLHEQAYRDFRSLVESLDSRRFEEKWLDDRWGVREIVAHITGWHNEFSRGFERMKRGEPAAPEGVDWVDIQHWNDIFAAGAQGKDKAQILREFDEAVARFRKLAAELPEEFFGPEKTASGMMRHAGTSHFQTHTGMIMEWLRRKVVA